MIEGICLLIAEVVNITQFFTNSTVITYFIPGPQSKCIDAGGKPCVIKKVRLVLLSFFVYLRFDLRPILYRTSWPWQFRSIDRAVTIANKTLAAAPLERSHGVSRTYGKHDVHFVESFLA